MKRPKHECIYKLRWIFTLLILLLCSVYGAAQEKPKSSEISFARHYAEDFLNENGANLSQMKMVLELYTDRLMFFNDMQNHMFLLMARDEYAKYLNEQVLAFSIGVPHSKAVNNETFMRMYRYYDRLILDMATGKVPKERKEDNPRIGLRPMLYNIRWNQIPLNSVFDGQTEPVLAGCGAVAVGQIMKYYECPKVIKGDYCYRDTKKNLRTVKMDGTTIDWSSINNIYRYSDTKRPTLEPLMKMVSKAVMSDYGTNVTTTWTYNLKRAMITNFGFSPAMFTVSSSSVDEATMIKLIREELKNGRPNILVGGQHIFVCDGAYEDFLHLNMGWGGSYDGWYRFPVVQKEVSDNTFIKSAILNIIPLEGETEMHKTVNVITPGTLATLLTEEECSKITSLKVTGSINGADIRLIRRMAGVTEPADFLSWHGVMTSLDLADATIVNDTVPYFVIDARKINYNITVNRKHYSFRNITDKEWQTFCADNGNKTQSYDIIRQYSTYLIKTKTVENQIGMYMFEWCYNLRHIILPRNIERISLRSFADCRCLLDITLPSVTSFVHINAFNNCISLETVKVCGDSPLLQKLNKTDNEGKKVYFYHCNPTLQVVADTTMETYASAYNKLIEKRYAKYNTPTQNKTTRNRSTQRK